MPTAKRLEATFGAMTHVKLHEMICAHPSSSVAKKSNHDLLVV